MKEIIIKCGSETYSRMFAQEATIGQIVNDPNVRSQLGYGDNVRALVSGVEQPLDTIVSAGTTIRVETRANTKAN